jgi:hypothetical protein
LEALVLKAISDLLGLKGLKGRKVFKELPGLRADLLDRKALMLLRSR